MSKVTLLGLGHIFAAIGTGRQRDQVTGSPALGSAVLTKNDNDENMVLKIILTHMDGGAHTTKGIMTRVEDDFVGIAVRAI